MIMKIRGVIQLRLMLGVLRCADRVLTVHDREHRMYHDNLSNRRVETRVIVDTGELVHVSTE